MNPALTVIEEARLEDRQAIDALRHRVYASELGQYSVSEDGLLPDPHPHATILCAKRGGELLGYVAVTPPGSPRLRIDHYLDRDALPFVVGPRTAEVRQLTVCPEARATTVAVRLLLASAAWLDAHDVEDVVSIGHDGVVPTYQRYGASKVGVRFRAGAMEYEVLHSPMSEVRAAVARLSGLRRILEREGAQSEHDALTCVHGGRALAVAGAELRAVGALDSVVDADVLDAWFPPSPLALKALALDAPRLVRTSPPPSGEPLVARIALRWDVDPAQVVLGAGSSDLVYRALTLWLNGRSRVLVLDPSYGEYAHVAQSVVGASVTRLALNRHEGYALSLARLRAELARGYDLVVIVNPNNPTGTVVAREALRDVLREAPDKTRIWVDEAYLHYVGEGHSLVADAAASSNLFVCRTLSKSHALSGLRAAFLVGPSSEVAVLRRRTPPWIVGFAAQVAALRALEDDTYYQAMYGETHALRRKLAVRLERDLGLDVFEGKIASVLVHLPEGAPSAEEVCRRTAARGVFLRDARDFGDVLGASVLRISVKDGASNLRTLEALAAALRVDPTS
ncbi:MAG: histidinol-phosphate transaminase [Polyangiales bacterium]